MTYRSYRTYRTVIALNMMFEGSGFFTIAESEDTGYSLEDKIN